jgi:hypothetical protein
MTTLAEQLFPGLDPLERTKRFEDYKDSLDKAAAIATTARQLRPDLRLRRGASGRRAPATHGLGRSRPSRSR